MSRHLSRRAVLGGALAMAGCSRVPTSGPVQQVVPASPSQVTRGVDVRPVPPTVDAPPDVVVAGFIDAMASLEDGHVVARQYLTDQAARTWQPEQGVVVFDGDSRTAVVAGGEVTLQAGLVGSLDAQGHYLGAAAGSTLRHTFAMSRVDGQWRIATPPKGLLVSQYTLQHRFRPVLTWYFGHSGLLAPERQWLAAPDLTPALAVQAQLQGPSAWFGPAVSNAIPVGTKLTAASVAVADRVATIALDGADNLPDEQRSKVQQQLACLLAPFGQLDSLRISSGGQTWTTGGPDSSGAVRLDGLRGALPVPGVAPRALAAVVKGRIGRLDEAGAFAAVDGPGGTQPWADGVAHLAIHGVDLAFVSGDGRQLLTRRTDRPAVRARLTSTGLGRPQFTTRGDLWVASGEDGSRALHRLQGDAAPAVVAVASLAGTRIRAFAVSPDEARMAVVVQRGSATQLGLLRLNGATAEAYRVLPVVVGSNAVDRIIDVGWTDAAELMVLASTTSQGQPSAWLVTMDGAEVTPVGPSADQVATTLVTSPQEGIPAAWMLLDDGQVVRHDAAWRWPVVTSNVSAVGPCT